MQKSLFVSQLYLLAGLVTFGAVGCAVSAYDPSKPDGSAEREAAIDPITPAPASDAAALPELDPTDTKDAGSACANDTKGSCVCGEPVVDTDRDTVPDCADKCPTDPLKVSAGECGCGVPEQPGVPCDAALPPEAGCSYASFGDHSYYVCTTPRTYSAARELCGKVGLDLVVVETVAENDFVQQQIGKGKQAWIGLSDARVEGIFRWVDGSAAGYLNFASGEPNSTAEDCVEALGENGQWNDKSCDASNPYVCEQVVSKCQASGAEVCDGIDNDCDGGIDIGVCPTGCAAVTQKGRVYTVCSTQRNWLSARDACAGLGATLARVVDADENQFLRLLARSIDRNELWLGASDRESEGVWRWEADNVQFWQGLQAGAGGSAIGALVNAWNAGEPSNSGDEDCALLQSGADWRDESCDDLKPYVCAK